MADAVRTPVAAAAFDKRFDQRSDEKRPYTGGGNRFDKAGEPRPFESRSFRVAQLQGHAALQRRLMRAPAPAGRQRRTRQPSRRASTASQPAGDAGGDSRPRFDRAEKPAFAGKPRFKPGVRRQAGLRRQEAGQLQEEVRRQGGGSQGFVQGRQGRTREARQSELARLKRVSASAALRARCHCPRRCCGSRCSSKYWRMFSNMSSWIFGLPIAQPMNDEVHEHAALTQAVDGVALLVALEPVDARLPTELAELRALPLGERSPGSARAREHPRDALRLGFRREHAGHGSSCPRSASRRGPAWVSEP